MTKLKTAFAASGKQQSREAAAMGLKRWVLSRILSDPRRATLDQIQYLAELIEMDRWEALDEWAYYRHVYQDATATVGGKITPVSDIEKLMIAYDYSDLLLADEAGIGYTTIRRFLTNPADVYVSTLVRVCACLGINQDSARRWWTELQLSK